MPTDIEQLIKDEALDYNREAFAKHLGVSVATFDKIFNEVVSLHRQIVYVKWGIVGLFFFWTAILMWGVY